MILIINCPHYFDFEIVCTQQQTKVLIYEICIPIPLQRSTRKCPAERSPGAQSVLWHWPAKMLSPQMLRRRNHVARMSDGYFLKMSNLLKVHAEILNIPKIQPQKPSCILTNYFQDMSCNAKFISVRWTNIIHTCYEVKEHQCKFYSIKKTAHIGLPSHIIMILLIWLAS